MEKDRFLDLINMAITREEEAYWFYTDLLGRVADDSTKDTLLWIAEEEKKHRAFLIAYRRGVREVGAPAMPDPVYYSISEYISEPEFSDALTSAEVFLIASHRENRAHRFYSELADLNPEGETRELLKKMAMEELRHKEKMEYLYSNTAFPQTAGG